MPWILKQKCKIVNICCFMFYLPYGLKIILWQHTTSTQHISTETIDTGSLGVLKFLLYGLFFRISNSFDYLFTSELTFMDFLYYESVHTVSLHHHLTQICYQYILFIKYSCFVSWNTTDVWDHIVPFLLFLHDTLQLYQRNCIISSFVTTSQHSIE